jgi:hypothetical protein
LLGNGGFMKIGLRFLGLGSMFFASSAFGADPNYLMVSLGDSITAGAFANTSTQQALPLDGPLSNLLNLNNDLSEGLLWSAVDNQATYSWASGQLIQSAIAVERSGDGQRRQRCDLGRYFGRSDD